MATRQKLKIKSKPKTAQKPNTSLSFKELSFYGLVTLALSVGATELLKLFL